jgi:hypothetical protein
MKNKHPNCQIPRAGANNSGESQKVSEDGEEENSKDG